MKKLCKEFTCKELSKEEAKELMDIISDIYKLPPQDLIDAFENADIFKISDADVEKKDTKKACECDCTKNECDCEEHYAEREDIVISGQNVEMLETLMSRIDDAEGFENKYSAAMKFVGSVQTVLSASVSISEFLDVMGTLDELLDGDDE